MFNQMVDDYGSEYATSNTRGSTMMNRLGFKKSSKSAILVFAVLWVIIVSLMFFYKDAIVGL